MRTVLCLSVVATILLSTTPAHAFKIDFNNGLHQVSKLLERTHFSHFLKEHHSDVKNVKVEVVEEEKKLVWPTVNVYENFEFSADGYYFNETSNQLLPIHNMHIIQRVETSNNRIYQLQTLEINGVERSFETLTDFNNHNYISRLDNHKQCKSGDLPVDLNVRDVITNFSNPFNNKTRYLGVEKVVWDQKCSGFHTFEANDEVFYFCPKTLNLKWIKQGEQIFKVKNGLEKREKFSDAEFTVRPCHPLYHDIRRIIFRDNMVVVEDIRLFH
eukprot:403356967